MGGLTNPDIVEDFIADASQAYREIVQKIIALALLINPDLDFAIKWKQLTCALNGDFHHWLFAMRLNKKAVSLTFHFGGLLRDDQGSFSAGTSKFLRSLYFRSAEEIPEEAVRDFITQTLDKLPYFKQHWKEINQGERSMD